MEIEKELRNWTDWTAMELTTGGLAGYYRTNGKQVQVKTIAGERSKSTCHKDDKFNLPKGIETAFYRCHLKMIEKKRKDLINEFKSLEKEYYKYSSMIISLSK